MHFRRISDAQLIPSRLIEQLPNADVKRFYDFMDIALSSPTQFLWLIINEEHEICGFLWCEINLLDKTFYINNLSVSKAFWGNGEMVKVAINFLRDFIKDAEIKRVYWVTDRPTLFEKFGFVRSKNILLEYIPEEK